MAKNNNIKRGERKLFDKEQQHQMMVKGCIHDWGIKKE